MREALAAALIKDEADRAIFDECSRDSSVRARAAREEGRMAPSPRRREPGAGRGEQRASNRCAPCARTEARATRPPPSAKAKPERRTLQRQPTPAKQRAHRAAESADAGDGVRRKRPPRRARDRANAGVEAESPGSGEPPG